ncbi:MAG: amidohydrolase family protein [Streptosporangiales bacterium]|nr:amidohydrolase family protein [Streptosporangiales bacterium]
MAERLHLRGTVLPSGELRDLYVVDGRWSLTPVADAVTVADGGYLVPGLVDAHCHVGLGPDGPVESLAEARAQAELNRDRGALLLRDVGVPVRFAELEDDPDLPRILRAGQHIAPPKRYIRGYAVEVEPEQLADAVAAQASVGDGWVKLVGDWIDRDTGDLALNWPRAALVEAIAKAHAMGARVAVHTFGEEAIPDLLAAGIDSIEHGTGVSEDVLDDMVASGAVLVPTTLVVDTFGDIADRATRFPTYAARMRRLQASSRERLRAAYDAGVPIYVGTDAGGLPHGRVVEEIERLADICMSNEEALAAASWAARDWLGLPGIEEGAPADAVVYDADPRQGLGVLHAPRRMLIAGRVIGS